MYIKRKKRVKIHEMDIGQRRHHLIDVGDMILSNGFGIKHDCMLCQKSVTAQGDACPVCGPLT